MKYIKGGKAIAIGAAFSLICMGFSPAYALTQEETDQSRLAECMTSCMRHGKSAQWCNSNIKTSDPNCYTQYTQSCTLPWGDTLAGNGAKIDAFKTETVPYGNMCETEKLTCTNGTLSGNIHGTSGYFTKASCSVLPQCPNQGDLITDFNIYVEMSGSVTIDMNSGIITGFQGYAVTPYQTRGAVPAECFSVNPSGKFYLKIEQPIEAGRAGHYCYPGVYDGYPDVCSSSNPNAPWPMTTCDEFSGVCTTSWMGSEGALWYPPVWFNKVDISKNQVILNIYDVPKGAANIRAKLFYTSNGVFPTGPSTNTMVHQGRQTIPTNGW